MQLVVGTLNGGLKDYLGFTNSLRGDASFSLIQYNTKEEIEKALLKGEIQIGIGNFHGHEQNKEISKIPGNINDLSILVLDLNYGVKALVMSLINSDD